MSLTSTTQAHRTGQLRITERPSAFSAKLDSMDPEQIAQLFGDGDARLFRAVSHPQVIAQLSALADSWRSKRPHSIVTGGAGSSGRIAYILANQYFDKLGDQGICARPWIAGGLEALRRTAEGAEDDALRAKAEFSRLMTSDSSFIGISAGFSAPAVAAGLEVAKTMGCRCSALGNNPINAASSKSAPGLNPDGMRGILRELERAPSFFPLSVVVGPEILTGSSRLKAGSSTWIVLDALFQSLLSNAPVDKVMRDVIASHDQNRKAKPSDGGYDTIQVAHLIEVMAKTIRNQGQVYVVGNNDFGTVAMLDASEQRPTFGVDLELIRGYITGGWKSLLGRTAHQDEIDHLEAKYPAAVETLDLSKLKNNDLLISLGVQVPQGITQARVESIRANHPLTAKLMLNAISTGAMTRLGKVIGNRMVDLIASNQKLVDRAVSIIGTIAGILDEKTVREAYRMALKALHPSTPEIPSTDSPTLASFAQPGSVALAVLLLRGVSPDEALRFVRLGRPLQEFGHGC